jgi:DNA-binding CsgD family transcriptional regulator
MASPHPTSARTARPTQEQQLFALITVRTVETMIDAAFPVAASVVRCDFVSAFYRTTGPDGLLNERDSLGRTSGREFMQRYAELTPALPLAIAHPGIRLLTTRGVLPASSRILRRTPFYQEIMRPQGWRHGVSLCFWGEPRAESPIFVLSVYRREGRRDFGALDLAKLERMYPFFDFAVNRVREWEATQMVRAGMAITAHTGPHGFAILDCNLKLLQTNDEAHELCAAWDDAPATGHTMWRPPRDIARECRALHQDWRTRVRAGVDANALHRRIAHSRRPGLIASITMIAPSTEGLSEPAFVLEFTRIREDGGVLQKLTTAERAVAIVIAGGFSNQEIAERLGKTVHAVKFLLHRIYEKTGVTNRAALVAMLR